MNESLRQVAINDIGQVVSVALWQLDERERGLDNLRAALAVGLEDLERGDVIAWIPDFVERLDREEAERYQTVSR